MRKKSLMLAAVLTAGVMMAACGSDYTEADGQLLYESGNTRLSFVMKDDEVQSIIYSVK